MINLELMGDLKIDNGTIGPIAIPRRKHRQLYLKADKRPCTKRPMMRVMAGEEYNKEEVELD